MPLLKRQARVLVLLGVAALLASACGAVTKEATQARSQSTDMETIFEAQGQLLSDPARTLATLKRLGVDRVRVFVPWGYIAPDAQSRTRPAGLNAALPASYPAPSWAPYDAAVRAAAAQGVGVYLTLEGPAPLWAAGTDAPPGTNSGLDGYWKPSATEYGEFVRAVGTRYSGTYVPAPGAPPLPRVSFWSIWNEPNYGQQLAPQAIDQSTVEVAPMLYRGLADAGFRALQATGHGNDTILIGELAPRGITTGDNPGNFSGMVPLRFLRALYCVDQNFQPLRGAAAQVRGCPTDAAGSQGFAAAHPGLFAASGYAVHLYAQGGTPPNFVDPIYPDYADLGSAHRLEANLDRLLSTYGSSRRYPLWDTEFGYQTDPPEPRAGVLGPVQAAAYLNWAEYLSWRDPRIASWDQYLLTDPQGGNFATGLEFADGRPKATYDAFRVPIYLPATSAASGQPFEIWGCVRPAPAAGRQTHRAQAAQIQFAPAAGGAFKTLRRLELTGSSGDFDIRMALPGGGQVRIAWRYPHGPQIYSRSVAVTIR